MIMNPPSPLWLLRPAWSVLSTGVVTVTMKLTKPLAVWESCLISSQYFRGPCDHDSTKPFVVVEASLVCPQYFRGPCDHESTKPFVVVEASLVSPQYCSSHCNHETDSSLWHFVSSAQSILSILEVHVIMNPTKPFAVCLVSSQYFRGLCDLESDHALGGLLAPLGLFTVCV